MALLKNLALMTSTTAVRLVAGFLTLAITGRALGPEEFGVLMYWMSIAGLLCVLSNFGLGSFLLREIGRDRPAAALLIGRTLTAKLMLSAGLLVAAAAFVPAIHETRQRWIYFFMLLALILEGFSEYVIVCFRARERFDVDTKVALMSTVINCSVVGYVAWYSRSTLCVATAYFLSRGLVLGFAWYSLIRLFGRVHLAALNEGFRTLRRTFNYAVDTAMGALFGQVDSVVLNHFVGPLAVGLHQAGMRFFMAGLQAATIMTNVFVPRAAQAHRHDAEAYQRERWRLQVAFLSVGAAGGMLISLGGASFVHMSFGNSFSGLADLMPLFGLLFTVRFAAASWGVILMIEGQQTFRATASALHWGVVAAVTLFAVPAHGNGGWLCALIVGNLMLLLAYVLKACRPLRGSAGMVCLTLISLAAALPFLRYEW